ncbi:unnamed protein product, partial [marine sediment metagenome]
MRETSQGTDRRRPRKSAPLPSSRGRIPVGILNDTTGDPDPYPVEFVRVNYLDTACNGFCGPELIEDSKADIRTEKFGEIDTYGLEMFARKKGGKPLIAIRATAFAPVSTTDSGSAYPEAVGRALGGIRIKIKTN